MQFSHLSIHEYLQKPEKQREKSGKMGYTTQLLTALVYKTGTKLMLRQSSSSLVKYVNYIICKRPTRYSHGSMNLLKLNLLLIFTFYTISKVSIFNFT